MKIAIFAIIFITFLSAQKIIKIDLSKQKIYAIDDGKIVYSGKVTTGKRGHRTPQGSFRVLEKKRFHVSSKYPEPNGGAKMPYMLRITKKGIAIHQGPMRTLPASHGCIRVSKSLAKKLFKWAKVGDRVLIYGDVTDYEYFAKKRLKRAKAKKYAKRKHIKRHKIKRYASKRFHKRKIYRKNYKRSYKRKSYKRAYVRRQVIKPVYEVIEAYDEW